LGAPDELPIEAINFTAFAQKSTSTTYDKKSEISNKLKNKQNSNDALPN